MPFPRKNKDKGKVRRVGDPFGIYMVVCIYMSVKCERCREEVCEYVRVKEREIERGEGNVKRVKVERRLIGHFH